MGLTVEVNGLTLCHKGSGGRVDNTVPDVCKTPDKGIPVPYKNRAYSKDLASGTTTVFADGGNMIANYGSIFAVSIFDEGGSMGGIVSGTHKAEADWITFSPDVFFEGKPACRLTDKMFMNHRNTVSLGGELQADLSGYAGSDAAMKAACEVFCTVRQEGIDAKKRKPGKKFDYSKRAKELSTKHPGLSGFAKENKFLHAVKKGGALDKLLKASGRAPVALSAIKSRLMKTALAKAAQKTAEKFAKTAARRIVLKFIPVLNVLSTAYDIYDTASAALDALDQVEKMLQQYDPGKATTYSARPDLARVDPATGKPTEVLDYKFDRPPDYKDGWQKGQKELYRDMVGGDPKKARKVDMNECDCRAKTPG